MVQSPVFPITRWTLIIAAGQTNNRAADDALAELCRAYWLPIYVYVRRFGHPPDQAQDLTQGFFAYFLETRGLAHADPAKGRFRSFLLTCLKRFLGDEADRRDAQKRGGQTCILPLDFENAEIQYSRGLSHQDTPEKLFERQWTLTLISRVTDDVREAFRREGRGDQFDRLRQFLPGHEPSLPYADAARQFGVTEGALKVAVHRLRRRYRETFHAHIADLVTDPALVNDEVQYLLATLRT
jgi:DNA-directed RNA polymerase specialized sigma24 family protein